MEHCRRSFFWLITLIIILIFSVDAQAEKQAAKQLRFQNVIIFGDSLSDAGNPNAFPIDVGNNYWVKSLGKLGAPITSLDPDSKKHLLWVNYFVENYFPGKTIYPATQIKLLQLNPWKDNLSYAWASAESGKRYINDSLYPVLPYLPYSDDRCLTHGPGLVDATMACVPGVQQQIQAYLADVRQHPNPNSLFIIWAGGNDIFDNLAKIIIVTSGAKDQIKQRLKNILDYLSLTKTWSANILSDLSNPIINILQAKDMLIKAGVSPQQIYVIDLPDLSKTPAARDFAKGNSLLLGILSLVTTTFNTNLHIALAYNLFNKHNLPNSHIYSANALFKKIISDPLPYQFTNVTGNCAQDGKLPFCTGYVFYDDKHPTPLAGKILGKDFAEYLATHL